MRKSGKIGQIAIALIALMGLSCSGAEAPRQPASLAEISGQWDVVSFDGFTPVRLNYQGDRNTRVDITEDFIGLKLTCNSTGIAARLSEDGRLIKNPRGSGAGVTAMSCPEIDRERQFFSLFFDEPKVERPSENRLRFHTDQYEVIVERSHIRRLVNAPKTLDEIGGAWHVALYQGRTLWIGRKYVQKTVTISPESITYGDCVLTNGSLATSNDSRLMVQPAAQPSCQDMNEAEAGLIATITQNPEMEWTMIDDLRLAGGNNFVLLTREPDW